jgi:N-acetylmuramoyl-L-alanine amidase
MEWQFNRDLARRIQEGLCALGYDARLLVPEDNDLPLKARLKRARHMVEEHKGHGGIAPNRVLISVHANAAPSNSPKGGETAPPQPSPKGRGYSSAEASTGQEVLPFGEDLGGASGWECFANGSSWNSRHLGRLLLKHAKEKLPKQFPIRGAYGNLRREGVRPEAKVSKFFITRNAPCFAVLTENLFMDNRKDCNYLLSDTGRDTLARIHIDAIDEFFAHDVG